MLGLRHGPRAHGQESRERDEERAGVGQERCPWPHRRDDEASECRPDEPRRGTDEVVERVRLDELGRRNDLRDDRRERRPEDCIADREQHDEGEHVPELERAHDRQGTDRADGRRADEVGRHHHPAALDPVGEHAAEDHQDELRDDPRDAHERHRRRTVVELEHLPGDRDVVHPVPQQRDRHPRPEQREVAQTERSEHLDAAEPAHRRDVTASTPTTPKGTPDAPADRLTGNPCRVCADSVPELAIVAQSHKVPHQRRRR